MDPLLIVTGAAAAGKSTAGAALARAPGLLCLDGDVLASGAVAVADDRRDYPGFWAYLLDIAAEVRRNGLVPAYAGVCLPDQVLGGDTRGFAVHLLALVTDARTVEERIRARPGDGRTLANLATHLRVDAELRTARVAPPHSLTLLDTRGTAPTDTARSALAWAAATAGPARDRTPGRSPSRTAASRGAEPVSPPARPRVGR